MPRTVSPLGQALLALGALLIAYAIFSGNHYKGLLRASMGAAFEMRALPADVYATAAAAFAASLAGATLCIEGFRGVHSTGEAPLECVGGGEGRARARCARARVAARVS